MFRDFASGGQREHRPPHAKERASEAQKSVHATIFFFLLYLRLGIGFRCWEWNEGR